MANVQMVIPFRDRGRDPRRAANLDVVHAWWYAHGYDAKIVSDGLEGDDQFNRHRAYNRAVSGNPDADVFVFTEADMLIHPDQIAQAVDIAVEKPGLVVPFTSYRYLSDETTDRIRFDYQNLRIGELASTWEDVFNLPPESVMSNGKSIGAVNVVSRETLELTGGYTEATSGNWYDDNIIEEGFAFLTNPTRWIHGPAVHMYHLPGWKGGHLTEADRLATQRNKSLLVRMRTDIFFNNTTAVKELMATRQGAK